MTEASLKEQKLSGVLNSCRNLEPKHRSSLSSHLLNHKNSRSLIKDNYQKDAKNMRRNQQSLNHLTEITEQPLKRG